MTTLRTYIVVRTLMTIPIVFTLLTIVFIILRVMPGDPITAMVGMKAPPEYIERLKEEAGLNKPYHVQYVNYIFGIVRGDFGRSLIWGRRPVLAEILDHLPATIELTIFGFLVSIIIGLTTGTIAGVKCYTRVDTSLRLYSIVAYALFIPWLGMMFQLIFGVYLKILPVGGRIDPGLTVGWKPITGLYVLDGILTSRFDITMNALYHLILPSLTLGIVLSGAYTRLVRANMIDVLSQDFIRAARARGLSEFKVLKHALKNAFIPILTMMGLQFAILLTGAVLTETTFSWPGMGTFLLERIKYVDYTTIQGTIVFFAIFVSVVNLVVDILYALIDPRIRY